MKRTRSAPKLALFVPGFAATATSSALDWNLSPAWSLSALAGVSWRF